jgi:hypothetical protein
MNKIYLAIPYSHEQKEIMERRFAFVTRYAACIASSEVLPFSPITHSHEMAKHGDLPRTWDFWRTQDIPFLDWADELRVLQAEGHNDSEGVNSEIQYWMEKKSDFPTTFLDPLETTCVNVVGISGRKRCGKDTAADILCEEYGYEKYSFADPIKSACREIFGFDDDQLYGSKKEDPDSYWGFSPREAMQVFGTDSFRDHFGSDIWVRRLFQRLRLWLPRRAVIPDVRFPNEVEAIQNIGGRVIRIDASVRLGSDDTHPSESSLSSYDGFDHTIDNNGTEQQFKERIKQYFSDFHES